MRLQISLEYYNQSEGYNLSESLMDRGFSEFSPYITRVVDKRPKKSGGLKRSGQNIRSYYYSLFGLMGLINSNYDDRRSGGFIEDKVSLGRRIRRRRRVRRNLKALKRVFRTNQITLEQTRLFKEFLREKSVDNGKRKKTYSDELEGLPLNRDPSDVLVIVSCSKSKLSEPAPAIRLYQGDIFKKATKWAGLHGFHEIIISAKYGFVEPNRILEPYDKRIKTKSEARELRPKVIPSLRKILPNYKLVILILGNAYLETIKPLIDEFDGISFYRLDSQNGIFDYKRNLIRLLRDDLSVLKHFSGPPMDPVSLTGIINAEEPKLENPIKV